MRGQSDGVAEQKHELLLEVMFVTTNPHKGFNVFINWVVVNRITGRPRDVYVYVKQNTTVSVSGSITVICVIVVILVFSHTWETDDFW